MITAKRARELTDSYLGSVTPCLPYVMAIVLESMAHHNYDVQIGSDILDIHKVAYLKELGYKVKYIKQTKKYKVSW